MKNTSKYLQHQLSKTKAFANKPIAEFTEESLHEFRLSIKKIKSLFHLLKFYKEKPNTKFFKKLKKIFDSAGAVREKQLEISKLQQKYPAFRQSDFESKLKDNLQRKKTAFFKRLDKLRTLFSKNENIDWGQDLKNLTKKDVEHYLQKTSKHLIQTFHAKKPSNDEMHLLRRRLKNIYYVKKSSKIKINENQLLSKAKSIGEKLGEWHDARMMFRNLNKAPENFRLSKSEELQIKKIKKDFAHASKKHYARVLEKLESI